MLDNLTRRHVPRTAAELLALDSRSMRVAETYFNPLPLFRQDNMPESKNRLPVDDRMSSLPVK